MNLRLIDPRSLRPLDPGSRGDLPSDLEKLVDVGAALQGEGQTLLMPQDAPVEDARVAREIEATVRGCCLQRALRPV